jgi:hypothetical protein
MMLSFFVLASLTVIFRLYTKSFIIRRWRTSDCKSRASIFHFLFIVIDGVYGFDRKT